MPALLINIKIDSQEKLELFGVTLFDISCAFEEFHVKIRGKYSAECIDLIKNKIEDNVYIYQELQEGDWISATIKMLDAVKSRSVFLYLEDHKLLEPRKKLTSILAEFDLKFLDYMCYTFFRASELGLENLLPLNPKKNKLFSEILIGNPKLVLIGKISPRYCAASLASIFSVEYLRAILGSDNKRFKIYNKYLVYLLMYIFGYPGYRKIINFLNLKLANLDITLCIYDPSSPFNVEKLWFENIPNYRKWRYGFLNQELFANYDDDNGAFGESLIKRGLYPFDHHALDSSNYAHMKPEQIELTLDNGEFFDCTYYSRCHRIGQPPIVKIFLLAGEVDVNCQGINTKISAGSSKLFFSNLKPIIHCHSKSRLRVTVYDEVF